MSTPFILKIQDGTETRLRLYESAPTLVQVYEHAEGIGMIGHEEPPFPVFKYSDEEGDEITILNERDLKAILQLNPNKLKLTLRRNLIKPVGYDDIWANFTDDSDSDSDDDDDNDKELHGDEQGKTENSRSANDEDDEEQADICGPYNVGESDSPSGRCSRDEKREHDATSNEAESHDQDVPTPDDVSDDPAIRNLFDVLKEYGFPLADDLQELSMDDWCAIATFYAREIDSEIEDFVPVLREQANLMVQWLRGLSVVSEKRAARQLEHMRGDLNNLSQNLEGVRSRLTGVIHNIMEAADASIVEPLSSYPAAAHESANSDDVVQALNAGEGRVEGEVTSASSQCDAKSSGYLMVYDDDSSDSESESEDEGEEEGREDAGDLSATVFGAKSDNILTRLAAMGFDDPAKKDQYIALALQHNFELEGVVGALVDDQ